MMQVVPGSFLPRPSDEEIARVEAWKAFESFQAAQKAAESLSAPASLHFMGERVDARFSTNALLGIIASFAENDKDRSPAFSYRRKT